eukprot:GEMP01064154.1.p1 GENE.GEMP01064154.1~~GEMP01064154.1.p1  ORF type:complete len:278 (+),score=58.70 GEMP01064154.1:141-974(+)
MGRAAKDKRDIYYRKAKEEGYRARSAYKLLQVDERMDLLSNSRRIVDLCAAPGSWCQVMAKQCPVDTQIVAVDLQEMAPISPAIHTLQGDITAQGTVNRLKDMLCGDLAQLVVMDGAPDVLQIHDFDEYIQHQLVYASLNFAVCVLETGGAFVAKLFRGPKVEEVYSALFAFFSTVSCCKPRASRVSSPEVFVVAQGFRRHPTMPNPVLEPLWRNKLRALSRQEYPAVPYYVCGTNALDSDRNYHVEENHEVLSPIQPPIKAAYEDAVRRKRGLDPS